MARYLRLQFVTSAPRSEHSNAFLSGYDAVTVTGAADALRDSLQREL